MADVSFNVANPYQTQLDELARRQKMAEIMQQQSFQPAERYSYQGIEAPISPLTGLSKALQMYMSGREQGKINEERKALGERYRQEGMDDITRYAEMVGRPAVAAVPGSEAFMPMGADYEDRGSAPAFKLDEQGMVPAVDPVAARMRGQIDPSMIGQFNTPEMRRMALAQMLKQGEAPAAFNLGADETRFQPPVGGGAPVAVARGAAKPAPSPFAPINPKDYTSESLTAAIKPDGTVDRTLLVAVTAAPTGNLAELSAENADRKQRGLAPLSISQYREQIAKAGRTPAAVTYGAPFAATDSLGNAVFLQPGRTGNAPSVIQGFTPPAGKPEKLNESEANATAFGMRMQSAEDTLQKLAKKGDLRPAVLAGIPYGGAALAQTLPSFLGGSSDEQQQVQQAKTNFITAVLRKESGAAIGVDEYKTEDKKYFPQVNDGPGVIKQKQEARKLAIEAIKIQAGSGGKNIVPRADPLGIR